MLSLLESQLDDEDDPDLWQCALAALLAELGDPDTGTVIEVGRCSHWLRPHQSRWTADGGFAAPIGYSDPPELDWSVRLEFDGDNWGPAKRRKRQRVRLRVAIPSRTTRHRQAAVHTIWLEAREKRRRFYGFRRHSDGWACTARAG